MQTETQRQSHVRPLLSFCQDAAHLRPEALRVAIVADMNKFEENLSKARHGVEAQNLLYSLVCTSWPMSCFPKASVAGQGSSDALMSATQVLVEAIADYKRASVSVKGMCKEPKAKAKGAAKP